MSKREMTSLQRVITKLAHQEPDLIHFSLLVTMHGAKELVSIKEYFPKAENVVYGQLRLRARYRNDCLYNFIYASMEIKAWGGEVIYCEDGPPNSGAPIIRSFDDIRSLEPSSRPETHCRQEVKLPPVRDHRSCR